MENLIVSKRAKSDKKIHFIAIVKNAHNYIESLLLEIPGVKLKLGKLVLLHRRKSPIGIVFGSFYIHQGPEKIYKNRIIEFCFFPEARLQIGVRYPQIAELVCCNIDLSQFCDIDPILDAYLKLTLILQENKKTEKYFTQSHAIFAWLFI